MTFCKCHFKKYARGTSMKKKDDFYSSLEEEERENIYMSLGRDMRSLERKKEKKLQKLKTVQNDEQKEKLLKEIRSLEINSRWYKREMLKVEKTLNFGDGT